MEYSLDTHKTISRHAHYIILNKALFTYLSNLSYYNYYKIITDYLRKGVDYQNIY